MQATFAEKFADFSAKPRSFLRTGRRIFFDKKLQTVPFLIYYPYICGQTKGCPTGRAEIIPYEPDAVSTDEGIVRHDAYSPIFPSSSASFGTFT